MFTSASQSHKSVTAFAPPAITTVSSFCKNPSFFNVFIPKQTNLSIVSWCGNSLGIIFQHSPNCLYVLSFCVIANIGHSGPKLDTILEVLPVFVYAIIAFALIFAADIHTE